ncbi:MAG: hypothetical protein KatS3mg118_2238 [Paracoccaceae bacterium]|nr:MAG: hypothetical protein KatS3mg118_2238 [Paracoccaceae bacterium]
MGRGSALALAIDRVLGEPVRQFRPSFLPPLMVYLAAGISGLTAIAGTFFVKEQLDLSAAFLAGLGFWAGLPWVMKMPLGHLVDLIWRWKTALVWLGAGLVAASLLIMHALIADPAAMTALMPAGAWFVLATLLAPAGYVLQDVVADAMTVEAVPASDPSGAPLPEAEVKALHTTMQTLARFAIIAGSVLVAIVNIVVFDGAQALPPAARAALLARVYLIALAIPAVSVTGVILAPLLRPAEAAAPPRPAEPRTRPDWRILGGGLGLAAASIALGLLDPPFAPEITFAVTLSAILYLMRQLMQAMPPARARALIGTAIIVFVFRAVPLPGPGLTWFEIDVLGFDAQFLAVLSLITGLLSLAGLIVLRPLIARRSIAWVVVLLSVASGILALPNIGLYFGIHHWTAAVTGGVVDARFIAILDTAVESPLGQIAMVPLLAWIARNAPAGLKATFFAVMAGFTNLALSASSLGTRWLNQLFVVTREVRDPATGAILVPADYGALGTLLILVALIGVAAPLVTVFIVQHSPLRSTD